MTDDLELKESEIKLLLGLEFIVKKRKEFAELLDTETNLSGSKELNTPVDAIGVNLASLTGLSQPTISNTAQRLLRGNFIKQKGKGERSKPFRLEKKGMTALEQWKNSLDEVDKTDLKLFLHRLETNYLNIQELNTQRIERRREKEKS